jgi:NADH-quinone oxidoreductase subunit K
VIPLSHVLAVSGLMFAMGLLTVVARRNALFMLLGVEIMLAAAGLAFVGAGAAHRGPDGQVMFVFILVMAAAEAAVGLAVILRLRQVLGTLDADAASRMGG